MVRTLLFLIAALTIGACSTDNNADNNLPDPLIGTWYGTLPCADCEGIRYEITFSEGGKFVDGMQYLGRSSNIINASGGYEITDGVVALDKPTEGYRYLTGHRDGLLMLDKNGGVIEGGTASLYILRKRDEATASEPRMTPAPRSAESAKSGQSNTQTSSSETDEAKSARMNRNMKKWDDGVNFHAYGNEPNWYLDLKFEESMTFESMDDLNISTPMGTPADVNDAESTQKYRAETESSTLIVTMTFEECVDQMSGEKFDYSVEIQAKNNADTDYNTYKGCGAYTIDPRLHNIWVIEQHNGEQVDMDVLPKGLPQIDLNVREGVYMGHDGCNSLRGALKYSHQTLQFQSGPTTLMACNDGGKSGAIARDLINGDFKYNFRDRFVELTRDGKVVFLLKNVD